MSPTEDCPVFAFNGAEVSVGEVVRAALFRGELQASMSEVSLGIACEDQASQQDAEAEEGAVDAMVEQFRIENDLISAEETEAWLDKRGITAVELQDHFTRSYWRNAMEKEHESGERGAGSLSADLLGKLEVGLFVSGELAAHAIGLSRRLVARSRAETPADPARLSSESDRFLERTGLMPDRVAEWLVSLDREQAWLDGMLEMEASYRAMSDAILTPERLSKALSGMRLQLTRIELERVEFDSIDAAREGRLCVVDDHLSLEEVARESRYPFKRLEIWAGQQPEVERQKLLCAEIGEIQEPAPSGGVFLLSRVIRRTDPTLENPTVRRAVEQKILDTHFSETGAREISWLIR